jgi:release factor glutamine methyltransferase
MTTAAPASPRTETWDVKRLLEWTTGFFDRKGLDSPRLFAEMLLAHVLGVERIGLYTRFNRTVSPDELARLRDLVKRAADHEPVQYLVGVAHFYSLQLTVTPDVLVPRPETETLVELVLRRCRLTGRTNEPLQVLDLCSGSGAVALALARNLPQATVIAGELSPAAAGVAGRNAEQLDLADRVEIRVGDLFDVLDGPARFDLVTANPPYIPTDDLPRLDRNVREHEPHLALDGGGDGLEVVRRILTDAPDRLTETGELYIELQHDQGPAATALAREAGFEQVRIERDLSDHDRVLVAGG